jgi:NMD protein affecting ribosome stability and mRNA decay
MKLIICPSCGFEKKHQAKGLCKSCYCKTDEYKQMKKYWDKKYQSKNKSHINEVRKVRRTSDTYKESDEYVKFIIYNAYKIPRNESTQHPYFIESKKAELKLKRVIKKIKQNGE